MMRWRRKSRQTRIEALPVSADEAMYVIGYLTSCLDDTGIVRVPDWNEAVNEARAAELRIAWDLLKRQQGATEDVNAHEPPWCPLDVNCTLKPGHPGRCMDQR